MNQRRGPQQGGQVFLLHQPSDEQHQLRIATGQQLLAQGAPVGREKSREIAHPAQVPDPVWRHAEPDQLHPLAVADDPDRVRPADQAFPQHVEQPVDRTIRQPVRVVQHVARQLDRQG